MAFRNQKNHIDYTEKTKPRQEPKAKKSQG
jgi:hypothetical protein